MAEDPLLPKHIHYIDYAVDGLLKRILSSHPYSPVEFCCILDYAHEGDRLHHEGRVIAQTAQSGINAIYLYLFDPSQKAPKEIVLPSGTEWKALRKQILARYSPDEKTYTTHLRMTPYK